MTSYLGVNPENSRNIQRTMQVLHLSHNASANHAKFATFANKAQDKFPFFTHFTHVLLHICCIYVHILRHCRLVLSTYKFYHVNCILRLNVYVYYPTPIISGPIALIDPHSTPKKKKKKKKKKKRCRYARLQPVYCQLIALTSNILSLAKSFIGIGTVMLTPCLSFSIFWRPPAFLVSY